MNNNIPSEPEQLASSVIGNNEYFLLIWRLLVLVGGMVILSYDIIKHLDYFLYFYHNWSLIFFNLSFTFLILQSLVKLFPEQSFRLFLALQNDVIFKIFPEIVVNFRAFFHDVPDVEIYETL